MATQAERLAVNESELRQLRLDVERLWERHKARGDVLADYAARLLSLELSVARLSAWQRRVSGVVSWCGRRALLAVLIVGAEYTTGAWGRLLQELGRQLVPGAG